MPFETDLSCELKDIKKINRARVLVMLKSNWLFILLMLIVILAIVYGPGIIEGDKGTIFTAVTAPFVILVAFFIAIEMSTKMVFNKNKAAGNLHIHYTFYEDEFQMDSALVKNRIRFDALRGIDEDRNYFFLKLAPSKVLVVEKQNCSTELISFLKEKAESINSRSKRK